MFKNFYKSKIYKYLKTVGTLFWNNQLFIIAVFPLLLTFQVIEIKIQNSLFYYLVGISFGPAYLALLENMKSFIETHSFVGSKIFAINYINSFKKGIIFQLTYGFIQYILFIDILYFSSDKIISLMFLILLLIVSLMKINALLITTKYDIRFFDLIKASYVITILHPIISLQNLVFYTLPYIIIFYIPQLVAIISVSIFSFLIVKNSDKVFQTLTELDKENLTYETNN